MAELFQVRELLRLLLGGEEVRKMELKSRSNGELFARYDRELLLRLRSKDALYEARRFLGHFRKFLSGRPPTVDLAKEFLVQFAERSTNTRYRYTSLIKSFMAWYGEKLDVKVKVPKQLPEYVEEEDIEKLIAAMRGRKTHKKSIERDVLLVEFAFHSGLRRGEMANLKVGNISLRKRLVIVRKGKGEKDRVVPLGEVIAKKLAPYIEGKSKDERLFGLVPDALGAKITYYAQKAGNKLHTHSLRDHFATRILENGGNIRQVQTLLGHTDLNSTEKYTLLTDKHIRGAVDLIDKVDGGVDEIKEEDRVRGFIPLIYPKAPKK